MCCISRLAEKSLTATRTPTIPSSTLRLKAELSALRSWWASGFLFTGGRLGLPDLLRRQTFGYALARAVCACVALEFLISLTDHMMASAVTTIAIMSLFALLRNVVSCPQLNFVHSLQVPRRRKSVQLESLGEPNIGLQT